MSEHLERDSFETRGEAAGGWEHDDLPSADELATRFELVAKAKGEQE